MSQTHAPPQSEPQSQQQPPQQAQPQQAQQTQQQQGQAPQKHPSNLPLAVVAGINGNQGCAVGCALANSKHFSVRGFTIHTDAPEVQVVEARNVEVVKADFYDTESLDKAYHGAQYAFLMTVPKWGEENAEEKEFIQGKNMIEACKKAGVKHVIFTSYPFASKISEGKCKLPHFDAKGRIEEYLKLSGLAYTICRLPFFFENFIASTPPCKIAEEKYCLQLPIPQDFRLPMMSAIDIGVIAYHIFASSQQYASKEVNLCTEALTLEEMGKKMSVGIHKDVCGKSVSREEWITKHKGRMHADQLSDQFEFIVKYGNKIGHDCDATKQLMAPNILRTFAMWCSEFQHAIKLDCCA